MSGYPYGNPPGGYSTPYPVNYGSNPNSVGFSGAQQPSYYGSNPQPSMGAYGNNMTPSGPYPTGPSLPSYPNYYTANDATSYPGSTAPPVQQYGGNYNSPYSSPVSAGSSSSIYPNIPPNSGSFAHYGENVNFSSNSSPHTGAFHVQQPASIVPSSTNQTRGTIYPWPNFNAEQDCNELSRAMKGLGTNEKLLIEIITNRSNSQRQEIKNRFKLMFGQDLIEKLSKEVSGHFRETIQALFETPADFDARSLREALNSARDGTLREIILTRTNSELRSINDAFRRLFSKELEQEIKKRVSGTDFKRMLISAVQAQRDEISSQDFSGSFIDQNRVVQDVESLYKAGEAKFGTDEKTFNAIFLQRSQQHLRLVFDQYQQKYRKDISQVIRSEFSGDAKEAFLALISFIRDTSTFFAERLKNSMAGLGTRDTTLIRLVVTRSEIDLAEIKQRYEQIYRRSLAQAIRDETSGDYQRILLAIVK